ncbi:MAG TPA: pirin family protein [Steroidobacteraceae bacterium]|nr:pirin family protein [Steroidobacteraceae bacterium]
MPTQPAVSERFEARRTLLGEGLEIRRALPHRHRRTVGAWCFLDHAGPADYAAGRGVNVGPHPHIGLQTFSWMIEGAIQHRDSLGFAQWIRPGQVNLMTAGRGIAHSEESPPDEPGRVQLAQLWIALPESEANREPAFEHYPDLPVLERGGFRVTLLAGECSGERSPARVYTPLIGLDLATAGEARTELPLRSDFEYAVLVLEGAAELGGAPLEPGTLLYLGAGRDRVAIASRCAARVLLIGGEPMDGEILIWWNFVARRREEIEAATRDWNEGRRFGDVQGARNARLVAPDIAELAFRSGRK